jgi:hypothetical protein
MESKNLLTLAITLTVGIILAGSLLMPVISDTTETERTFTNEGYYRMSAYDNAESGDYTITWSNAKPTTLVIEDVEYNMSEILTVKNMYFSIFASDGAYMRVASGNTNSIVVQCHNSSGSPMAAFDSSNTNMTSMSITIDADSIDVTRVTDSTVTATSSYSDWIYVLDPNGNYIMKDKDKSAYVGDEDIIILAGVTNVATSPATPVGVYGHGTIDNLVIESGYPDDDTVYSHIVVNSDVVAGYIGLNTVGDITFDMTRDTTTTAATYSYYLVPVEVTAELTNHLSNDEIALLNALPIIVIIGLVLAGVGAIFVRNRD